MARRSSITLNTDSMFYGCSSLDAPNLSFHSVSPHVSSMDCMFYGAAISKSQSFDGEYVKFNRLVSCRDAFKNAGFSFDGTFMQFYGATGSCGNSTAWVSSVRGMFEGNANISVNPPTIVLSRNDSIASTSDLLTSLDCRFASTDLTAGDPSNDIYSKANSSIGIYDFSRLYSNTSISSVDMRGICNSLAASSVLGSDYVRQNTDSVAIVAYTPSTSAGSWDLSGEPCRGLNSLRCNDIAEDQRWNCVTVFENDGITEYADEGVPHIRKYLKLDYSDFGDGDFTLSFKYKLGNGSDRIGFDRIRLLISDGTDGTEGAVPHEKLVYSKFTVNGANGISETVDFFDGSGAATPDSAGWYGISYSCKRPSDVRIVIWNMSPTYFEDALVSNIRIVSKNVTVDAEDIHEGTGGNFLLYADYSGYCVGAIDFSKMFENCGNLRSYSGFIPQYGITYESMFNNCSSLDVDLSTMFRNFYLSGESTTVCYLTSVSASFEDGGPCEWDGSPRWDRDPHWMCNGFDSIRFHDAVPPVAGGSHHVHTYFALVDALGHPIRFMPHENIRLSFSFMDDMRGLPPVGRNLDAYFFIGDKPAGKDFWRFGPNRIPNLHMPIGHCDKWHAYGGSFRPGSFMGDGRGPDSFALIFGIRGTIPHDGRFWIGNFAIDSDLRHIRIGNFGNKAAGLNPDGFKFGYGSEQPQPVYETAYNTNTCLDGYCMSSIAYMFNNCNSVYASDDRFDAVSIVRKTAETLKFLGKDPSSMRECFEKAFPKMNIATIEPLSSLNTVTYDLNGISQKCGIMRYCAGTSEDSETYGIGTPYVKWLFGDGFLRYGGVFIDNPKQFFVIPYYRVENESGELVDVMPHTSVLEDMLMPDTYDGPYSRSAHFDDRRMWNSHILNPFGVHGPVDCGHHVVRNWFETPERLYGALVFDLDGNFIKKAYVGKWTERSHTLGHFIGYDGRYDSTYEREHPVAPYSGRNVVDIPDVGTVITRIQCGASSTAAESLRKSGHFVYSDSRSGDSSVVYCWKRSSDANDYPKYMFRHMGVGGRCVGWRYW